MDKNTFGFDTLGIISLILTFLSILFSFKLSTSTIIMSVGIFLVILATYVYLGLGNTINRHAQEIKRLNEKINIYKDISDLKAKVEILINSYNFKMEKRGQADFVEIFVRVIQIIAILVAGYIILKALGFKF